jgi:hypothetical protein
MDEEEDVDCFGLPITPPQFTTAVEARRYILSKSRDVVNTAARLATGQLSAVSYRGDVDVLRQYLTMISKLKIQDDPISIPATVLEKLHQQPQNCQWRLEELFLSFLDGAIPMSQLKNVLEGFSYLFETTEIREISSLLREQKSKYGRR